MKHPMHHPFRALALAAALAAAHPALAASSLDGAKTYLGKGEVKAGVIELKNYLLENPDSEEAWLLAGESYLKLGDAPNAARAYEKARDLKAPKEKWLVPLGRAYLLQGDPKPLFDNIQPGDDLPAALRAQIYGLYGSAYLYKKDLDKARQNFDAALKLDPAASEALFGLAMLEAQQQQFQKTIDYANRILARDEKHIGAWVILGEAKRLLNDDAGAIDAFGKALKLAPFDPKARLGRATAYLVSNQLEAAQQDIAEVRKLRKDLPMALYLQAVIDFQQKKPEEAAELLDKAVTMMPDYPAAKWLYGSVAFQLGKLETAENQLTQFLNLVPKHPQAIKLLAATRMKSGRPAEAIQALKELEAQAKDDPQLLSLLGSAYLQNREFDLGNEYLTRAAKLAPEAGAIKAQLALGQIATGHMDQAVTDLRAAVDLDQNLLQADMLLVLALMEQKKFDEAIAASNALKAKTPDAPLPDNLLGAAYMGKGDKDRAVEHWKAALKLSPIYHTAAINLARLELDRNNPDGAIKYYEGILQRDPKHIPALLGLAAIAESRKEFDKMEKYLVEARDKNPKTPQPGLILSRYYLQQGKPLRALEIARDLQSSNPENPQVIQSLGVAQIATDQAASAAATFRKLSNLVPKNPEYRQQLAMALGRAGDPGSAQREWRALLKDFPDYTPAFAAVAEYAIQDKKFDEALKMAEAIKAKEPKAPLGWQVEGDAQFGRGEFKKAVVAYDKAYQMTPTSLLARRIYQAQRSDGNHLAALDALSQWLKAHPEDFDTWMVLGMGYEGAGQSTQAAEAFAKGYSKEAVAAYEKALSLKPDNPVTQNNLAWVYYKMGDPRALELAERLLPATEKNPLIMDTVGWIFVENGKLDKGLTLLQDAAVHAPQETQIRIHVAEALIKAGRKEDASNALVLLLKEKKDFPERKQAEALLKKL